MKEPVKQVVVVRRDLGMGLGKTAAQVAHAAVLGLEHARAVCPEWAADWWAAGQPKVVVQVPGAEEFADVFPRMSRTFDDDGLVVTEGQQTAQRRAGRPAANDQDVGI